MNQPKNPYTNIIKIKWWSKVNQTNEEIRSNFNTNHYLKVITAKTNNNDTTKTNY